MPPAAEKVNSASHAPESEGLLSIVMVAVSWSGALIVSPATAMQPVLSVSVKEYMPAHKPVTAAVVSPVVQVYVKGEVPAGLARIVPSQ